MSTLSPSYTVSADFVDNLVWAAEQEGLDVATWRLSLGGEHRRDTRLPLQYFQALWAHLVAVSRDPLIGLRLGRHFRLGRWGMVEFFLLNARTLGEALERSVSYWRLVIDEEKDIALEDTEGGRRLSIRPRMPHPPAAFEVDLSYVVRMVGVMLGQPVAPLRLGMAHGLPAGATHADYAAHFGCEVSFDQPCYWLHVPHAMATSALPTAHPLIMDALLPQAELQMKMLNRPQDLAGRVSQLIEMGAADVERAALQLGMSSRSLQRRLKEEGTSFVQLRDEALRRRAKRLLEEVRMPLKEVAYFLGYEDRGLFQACLRWFGATPGALRAQWTGQS